jgi:hypothetical protein
MTDGDDAMTLRVDPGELGALRTAFADAAEAIGREVLALRRDGLLGEPWLGDEVSRAVRDFYNQRVMVAADGPYAALVAYEAELSRVRDTLARMVTEYQRAEDEATAAVSVRGRR